MMRPLRHRAKTRFSLSSRYGEGGFATIVVLAVLIFMMSLMAVITGHLLRAKRRVVLGSQRARMLALAEAGVQKALWHIGRGDDGYSGQESSPLGKGYFTVVVRRLPPQDGSNYKEIVSTGSLQPSVTEAEPEEGPYSPTARIRVVVSIPDAGIVEWQRLR